MGWWCAQNTSGVANLWAKALSRGKKAQVWSLGDPASHRLFKHWGSPVVDLFTSIWAHRVLQYFSLNLSDRRASGEMPWKRGGWRASVMPPNIIQLVLGRVVKWGDLIMITPFWPDQKWFPEVICLAIEPQRWFRPSQWLLWNANTRDAIPKVMKNIQLTTWRLTLPSVPGKAKEKKLPGRSLTPGQKKPSRTTNRYLSIGVFLP